MVYLPFLEPAVAFMYTSLPSLNTQSCIKGLFLVRNFGFWAVWAAGPVLKKKILGRLWATFEGVFFMFWKHLLWCCGGICHQPDTFIQIGSGHTVITPGWYIFVSFKVMKKCKKMLKQSNHILSIEEVHSFFVMKPHSSKHLVLLGVCFASGVFIPVALGRFYKGFVKAKLK